MRGPTSRQSDRARRVGVATSRDRWLQAAISLLLVVGVVMSVMGARAWHSRLAAGDRSAFATRASDLAITVGSGLSRRTDFVAAMRSVVATTPHMTNIEFAQAIAAAGATERYPGGIGYAYFEYIHAADLAAFEATLFADPPNGIPITNYQIVPPGPRATYCLNRFASDQAKAGIPLGADLCAPQTAGEAGSVARASGAFEVNIVPGGSIGILAPVYVGGITPVSQAARTAAFTGWLGATFSSAGLLPAPGSHPGMRVQVFFTDTAAAPLLLAKSGPTPPGHLQTERLAVNADGPWTVEVQGVATGAGSSWTQAGVVLAAGLLLSTMLFGFVQVLARSRRRALRLVDERTGQLHHQALHDPLTGLPNRALILDRTEQMLARGRREHIPVAALFMDLDGFKDVNDTYGHAAGDQLLKAVAERISSATRARDTVGRLGGDEFVVLVDGNDTDPEMVAERLLAVVGEPYLLDEANQISVTTKASIGIAAGDRDNAGDLLRDADVALYQAKDAGGDRLALFAPGMQVAARDRVLLASQLRGALERHEFFLAYQPTFSLRDMTVTGVEALIRWRHPSRGIVPPDEFIPIAEETGQIVPIGRWVLDTACAEAATWQTPTRRLSVSVNISGRQLDTAGLVADVRGSLERSGLDPGLLSLEITEAALTHDATDGATRLRSLKAIGVKIAIDDFGTGYSSLNYLRKIPADAVKIDQSFIAAMAASPESAVIVRTLVQLGKALGIETLAEGIEEQGQLRHLQEQDCDSGQGFLFARPLTPEAIRVLITPLQTAVASGATPA